MNNLHETYVTNGFKALRCAGYHPSYNTEITTEKRYKRAKAPITKGYTELNYKGLTIQECKQWEAEGGWIGWLIPPGYIVLDIDGPGWDYSLNTLKAICFKRGLNPPIHRTKNGVHVFFKTAVPIAANSRAITKAGLRVTYRAGGVSQLILAPTNARTWGIPLNGNLPEIPTELKPFDVSNKEDLINVLAMQVGEAVREGKLAGYEDVDQALTSFLIEAGIDEGQALQIFENIYQKEFDKNLTSQMYKRAEGKLKNGEAVRGARSFIYALKEKGLDELLRITNKISGNIITDTLEWMDPIPFNDYSSLPGFPVEATSGPGRQMIESVSEINQIDSGMTASIYFSVLSACLARKGLVDLISHQEPLNIYTCSVLPSGNRKSSTMDAMVRPLYECQSTRQEVIQDAIRDALNVHKIREARLAKLQKQAASIEDWSERRNYELGAADVAREISENPVPVKPLFVVDDITSESLGIHMAENNECMAVMSTEGGIFDIMAGRYSDKGGNFDLYLKAHSGDSWSCHRVGREPKTMQSPALTMCLTVQPDIINEIGGNGQFRGRGLLARFLYSLCKSRIGYRGRQIKSLPASIITAYQRHIESLTAIPMTLNTLRLSTDAQELWDEFYNDIEANMREGGSLHYLPDWGSKLPGAVARIAGLLHFAEYGCEAARLPITVNIVSASCKIGSYFKDHAIAAFGLMEADTSIESAKKILAYLMRDLPENFKGRDVMRHTNFKTMDEVSPGLKILIERGYIIAKEVSHSGLGRPESITYALNPKIKAMRNS